MPRSYTTSATTPVLPAQDSFEAPSLREFSQESSTKVSSEQQVEYSETSSLHSDCRIDLKDDDSIAVEDRLEDESYPISDRIDSDFYESKSKEATLGHYMKEDSLEFDSMRDREDVHVDISATKKDDFSIYKTKEREDILDLDCKVQDIGVSRIMIKEHPDEYLLEEDDQDGGMVSSIIHEVDDDEIVLANDQEDEIESKRKTSFYIGESSVDIIIKSSEQKSEMELESEELSYDADRDITNVKSERISEQCSIESQQRTEVHIEHGEIHYSPDKPFDGIVEYERTVSVQEGSGSRSTEIATEIFTTTQQIVSDVADEVKFQITERINETKTKMELKLEKNETEQYTKFLSDSEDLLQNITDQPQTRNATVVHSPIKPLILTSSDSSTTHSIQNDSVTTTTAQVTEVRHSIHSELDQINESFAEIRSMDPHQIEQTIVEQTFAEVQESLQAVNEDLIDVVKDGRQIKESPSEFEFKLAPNLKYPQLEAHDEEEQPKQLAALDANQIAQTIETIVTSGIVEPNLVQTDSSRTSPKPDSNEISSTEDSVNKLDVIYRAAKGKPSANRWSVSDPDNYSSSGSHYESFEKTDSRPCSSDVENLYTSYGGGSSEYQTAHDASSMVPGSTEYQTAASTLDHSGNTISSHDSMKSFDSESSGHLGSIEVSEASETLVPSTMDIDLPSDSVHDLDMDESEMKLASLEACSGILLENFDEDVAPPNLISPSMKRSQEMIFDPYRGGEVAISQPQNDEHEAMIEQRRLGSESEDNRYGSLEETRFATSLEEGSLLSQSFSSSTNVETIVENVRDEMASSFGSSLVGSYEIQSLIRDDVTATSFEEPFGRIDNMVMTTSIIQEDNITSVNTQITTTIGASEGRPESFETVRPKKGHKRNDSTSFLKGLESIKQPILDVALDEEMIDHEEMIQMASSVEDSDEHRAMGSAAGAGGGSESDSDYDRYETEYSRSFKQPTKQGKKKSLTEKAVDKVEIEKMERKISIPSIETIVEDVTEEVEQAATMERAISQNMLDYSNIPDIMITDDPTKCLPDEIDDDVHEEMDLPAEQASPIASSSQRESTTPIHYAHESEIRITEEEYQDMIDKQYKSKMAADPSAKYEFEDDGKGDSPTSDSFEMLEQPDIADEFVIIEEVAKEADEFDTEGKSVTIQSLKYVKKHDDEVETMLVRSAPAATNEGSIVYKGHTDLGFDFEDSPPQGQDSSGAYDPNGLDSSRKWVEMQLAEQAQNLRYPYDMDRGVLEDIKEEDTDMEVGSSRISSFKDSFSSSTPDYDVLAGRRYFSKEHDDMSVNSLQEFESLEQAISLENRRFQHGSQDSLSNGSFPKRYLSKGNGGDDISLSSLKEFESMENACIEAHLIETKAKEEAALLLSRSDESKNSDNGSKSSPKMTTVTTVRTMVVTKSNQAEPVVIEERHTTVTSHSSSSAFQTGFSGEFDDNLMEVSSDSLDLAPKVKAITSMHSKDTSHHGSTDSLELNRSATDIMTSSIDSMEIGGRDGVVTGKSSRSDADSLEQLINAGHTEMNRRDSIDSIDMQLALMAQAAQQKSYDRDSIDSNTKIEHQMNVSATGNQSIQTRTVTTTNYDKSMTKDISSDSLNINQSEPELLLTSTESLDSSTTTNATYQNAGSDSQMSGSLTSCGSNTLIDTMDPNYSDLYQFQEGESSFFDENQASYSSLSTESGTTTVTSCTTTTIQRTKTKDGEKTFDFFEQYDNNKGRVF